MVAPRSETGSYADILRVKSSRGTIIPSTVPLAGVKATNVPYVSLANLFLSSNWDEILRTSLPAKKGGIEATEPVAVSPQEDQAPLSEFIASDIFSQNIAKAKQSTTKPSSTAVAMLRSHFAKSIISSLQKLQQHAGTPRAAVSIAAFFQTARDMRDMSQTDPYLEVVMALHDALAFENRWMDYTQTQYAEAASVMEGLSTVRTITAEKVEKAIVKLEEAGFDTTPFCLSEELQQPA